MRDTLRRRRTDSGRAALRYLAVAFVPLLPVVLICSVAYAEDGAGGGGLDNRVVMRVEEDWEAILNEPGADVDAPQFHTVISPFAGLDSYYLQVSWNYREQTDFTPGGMQLQAWQGDYPAGTKSYREDKLSTSAETISWTQSMETNGSLLTFQIDNGSSGTWGSFGGSETSLSGNVGIASLNAYQTATSANNSWVSFGANRVDLLRIKEVRRYDADGTLISRSNTPYVVYQRQD